MQKVGKKPAPFVLPKARATPNGLKALYGRPSVYQTYIDYNVDDSDPAPNQYDVPLNAFGKQSFSQHRTEPAVSILAKNEKSWSKVFITKTHVAGYKGLDAPGAGTYSPKGDAIRLDNGVGFAKSLRPDLSKHLGVEETSPGPVYDIREKWRMGGSVPVGPKVAFTRMDRFSDAAQGKTKGAIINVGPGQYGAGPSAIDVKKHRFSFGVSHRAYDKVTRPDCDKEFLGRESIGPGPPLWEDPSKDGSKAHSFSRANRFGVPQKVDEIPGPGAYRPEAVRNCLSLKSTVPFSCRRNNPPLDVFHLHESRLSDIRNPVTIKFGVPPKKGRVNYRALSKMTDRVWGEI